MDEKLNGTGSGYVYVTNTDGTAYKIKAHKTVESEKETEITKHAFFAVGLIRTFDLIIKFIFLS